MTRTAARMAVAGAITVWLPAAVIYSVLVIKKDIHLPAWLSLVPVIINILLFAVIRRA